MKKIGFITKNKMLAQSLIAAVSANQDVDFEIFPLLNFRQAAIDAEVLAIDIAVVDGNYEIGTAMQLCAQLRARRPRARLLFIVGQHSQWDSEIVVAAKRVGRIDDFLFYDASLCYLIAKLKSM